MVAESYSGFFQRYNMLIGVLICALFTSILYFILPLSFFFMSDIYLVVGNCFGLYFTFNNRKESQSHIKTGVIVGLVGSILSLILYGFYEWIFYSLEVGIDFILFLDIILFLFIYTGIIYVLVGVILGYIFGNYYKKREYVDKGSPLFKKKSF